MRAQEFTPSKLVIFDIDDTLVHTQTKVHVIRDGRVVKSLNSHDFTHYKLQPGESFDFGDFANAHEFFTNAKPIIPMINQLKHDIATGNKVVMVTARADFNDRELFLDTFRKYGVDMAKVHVYRAGNMAGKMQTEEKKKIIIRDLMNKHHYTKAIMYDDAVPNLDAFLSLHKEYPHTKFYAWHVSLEGEASEHSRSHMEGLGNSLIRRTMNFGRNIGTKAEPAVTVFTNPANQGAMIRQAAQAYPVTKLPLSKLKVNEPDSKMSYPGNRLNIMGMVDTIKKGGELPPIIVVPKNFSYTILDGHHRYTAYKMAGVNEVPVKILDPKDVKYTDIVDPTLARTTNEDQSDYEIRNYDKLDNILSKLCEMVVKGQKSDKDYGMVAAAVLDPKNQIVARLNRPGKDGKRIHAEHAAMLDYTNKYGDIPEGSIILTTLSPCNEHMDERDGVSCTELINNSTIKKVYCGYMDYTQDDDSRQFNLMETADKQLRSKCKQFADTFLDDLNEVQFAGQEIEGNILSQLKEKFPNLSTLLYFIPGLGQALVVADVASQIQMYNQAIDKIEKQYPTQTIQTVQQKVGDAGEAWETLEENFADGRHPEDKGDSARHGIPKHASISQLRKIAHQGGRKGQLAHWQANMRSGHKK